jgi:hypothetical protein
MSNLHDATTARPIYEVGWGYWGHPTPEEKKQALALMLERYGTEVSLWEKIPEIRYQHIDGVSVAAFGRGPLEVPTNCYWAVYGILKNRPDKGWVAQGVRLPMFEDLPDE